MEVFIIRSRIKELRKILGINQDLFANRISMSRSNLANIENGNVSLTDRVKNNIITEFNVNEEWFVTGKGEVFNNITSNLIDQLIKENSLDEIDKQTLTYFIQLDEASRKQVLGYIHRLLEEKNINNI
ncbi:helix-turn-helix transcriptional regulator [Vallitalea guaymasensis]|uniref:Helix-turn-helix transcriptional regulator n=3 Tax=Vallitalea guaymasensis TaxID=1185412 RepID=A0A8J8SD73_9FIRM|nr:helix-turn-helix transcriptional regulator [Vallitalea guaymasensis]QUH30593.1 helix-turn-helix transcriptional regulator [Vallitalea guaymasensis]